MSLSKVITVANSSLSTEAVNVTAIEFEEGTVFTTDTVLPYQLAIDGSNGITIKFDETENTGEYSESATIKIIGVTTSKSYDLAQSITVEKVAL